MCFLVVLFVAGDLQTGLFPVAAKGNRIGLGSLFGSDDMRALFATSADALAGEEPMAQPDSPIESAPSDLYGHKKMKDFGVRNTGPGIPTWQQQNLLVSLRWDDPVEPDQAMRLTFLRPGVNLVLALARSGLLLLLLGCLLGLRPRLPERLPTILSV